MLEQITNEYNVLTYIIREFYMGSSNIHLKPTDMQEISLKKQEEFLNATIECPIVKKYPMSNNFIKKFLKKFINCLETTNQDVHDNLFSTLCMAMNNSNNEEFCYRHYLIGNDLKNVVILRETNCLVVNGTTGLRTWEAAKMFSDWALCNTDMFSKKKVLELGSGLGFTGITIAKFCDIDSILLSDYHEDVLKAIRHNVNINFTHLNRQENSDDTLFIEPHAKIGVLSLDWNNLSDLQEDICPDIVIGTDIVYDPTILQPLFNVLQSLIKKNDKLEIYIAGVIRNEETFIMFLKLLDSSDLQYKKIVKSENTFITWDNKVQTYLLKINKNTQY